MKKNLLPIILSLPLVASTPLMTYTSCSKKSDEPEPTLVHKVTLLAGTGGTISKQWVEVADGDKWKNTSIRITTTPDDGMKFECWRDEQGKIVSDDTIIDKPRTFTASWIHADFTDDSWRHLCFLANQENGLEAMKKFYNLNSFIGLEREIYLSANKYKVRVIGENHDTIYPSTTDKASLTFQLCSLVSDHGGNLSKTAYSKVASKPEYKNTILRKNTDGSGSGEGYEPGTEVWNKSCLELLKEENPDLGANLKKVNKEYFYSGSKNTTYVTELFNLTVTEMGWGDMWTPREGEAYEYWKEHISPSDRIKKDIKGNVAKYALITRRLYTQEDPRAIFYIDTQGNISYEDYYVSSRDFFYGISFAFCI